MKVKQLEMLSAPTKSKKKKKLDLIRLPNKIEYTPNDIKNKISKKKKL